MNNCNIFNYLGTISNNSLLKYWFNSIFIFIDFGYLFTVKFFFQIKI